MHDESVNRQGPPISANKSHFSQRIVVFFDVSCIKGLITRLSLLSEIMVHELDVVQASDMVV